MKTDSLMTKPILDPAFDPAFDSLAGLIVLSVAKTTDKAQRDALMPFAKQLPFIKRFDCDHRTMAAVRETDAIPTREIIAQLGQARFPTSRFWLEGPFVNFPETIADERYAVDKFGALVSPNLNRTGFTFKVLSRSRFEQDVQLDARNRGLKVLSFMINNHFVSNSDNNGITTVSLEDGIIRDDKRILEIIQSDVDRLNKIDEFERFFGKIM